MEIEDEGTFELRFKDGDTYNFTFPKVILGGILMGKRTFNFEGQFICTNSTNKLQSAVRFNPDDRGFFSKMFSSGASFPDNFTGFICKEGELKEESFTCRDGAKVASVEGEFTDSMQIDGEMTWNHISGNYYKMLRPETILDSDSSLREDIILMKSGDLETAQETKVTLEERQRSDAKLRKN